MTQEQMVLRHLKHFHSITSWEAFTDYGITRLSAKIFNLREQMRGSGEHIAGEWVVSENRFGEPVRYKKYFIEKE